jgi:CDP-glycerol glycerophosphotransferase (TagB/SpsB family)
LVRRERQIIFYCADPIDYIIFQQIKRHLPEIEIETVVKNKRSANYLRERKIKYRKMPSFPDAVIMCRHAAYKFPEEKIIKIGFSHAAYHFKKPTKAENYNQFNVYFITSQTDVQTAQKMGINVAKAIGFPKLDPAFNGNYDSNFLINLKEKMGIDPRKKSIIFTATWDKSGMSAIDKWYNKLDKLSKLYNILVTVHPWTSQKYVQRLKSYSTIHFIEDPDILPYLMISDVLVGGSSSIIAEFCALDKPIITFRVPEARRSVLEIREMIKSISIQIDNFDEVYDAIKRCLENPNEKSAQRREANKIMFDNLDGKAGEKAAREIEKLLRAKNLI